MSTSIAANVLFSNCTNFLDPISFWMPFKPHLLFLFPLPGIQGSVFEFNTTLSYWVLCRVIQIPLKSVPSRELKQKEETLFQFVFPEEKAIAIFVD